jgi:hypothetical protein
MVIFLMGRGIGGKWSFDPNIEFWPCYDEFALKCSYGDVNPVKPAQS